MTKLLFLTSLLTLLLFSCLSNNATVLENSTLQNSTEEQTQNTKTFVQEQILMPELVTEKNTFESSIFIKTNIPKSNIYLNNIYQGKSPLKIDNIAPGIYLLTIEFNSVENQIIQKKFMIQIESSKNQNYYVTNEIPE